MKTFGLAAALVGAILLCISLLGTTSDRHALAQQPSAAPQRPMIFVPGLLGSRLCRNGPDGENTLVWGAADSLGEFPTLAVAPVTAGGAIEPCGLIHEISFLGIFSQTVYGPFIERLRQAGYRDGETLFVFDYDWRLSVFDNAGRLAEFVEETIPGEGRFDIVAHSMGGLVARIYALEGGGAERIARFVSAGTPWRGSVQVFQLLEGGWGLGNLLLGGLEAFRRTVVSFPSTFELIPSYSGCCGGSAGPDGFDAANAAAWARLGWTGIGPATLPDLAETAARQARLRALVATPLPAGIEAALVIGVDQRTPEHYDLQFGPGGARLAVRTSWEGDGTVLRDSARLPAPVTYPTSFATHDAILNDPSVQDFVLATLAEGPEAAIAAVPVRERTSILTALGDLVELVGVAIRTDRPAYRTGATAKVTVHLRLDVEEAVDASALALTVTPPGGAPVPVALTPDPAASDPAVPLEQSFSATIETGEVPGALTLTVTLEEAGDGAPRTVTRVVPVLAG